MTYYNLNKRTFNFMHFQGPSLESYDKVVKSILEEVTLVDSYNSLSEPISIVSVWTDDEKCILKQQMDKAGITLYNARDGFEDEEWYMPNKIKYYLNVLSKVESDIVIMLDGYDTLVLSFDDVIEKFKACGYRVLFNASRYKYPSVNIERVPENDYPLSKFFNAGCCIGYREDLIRFYTECLDYIYLDNPQKSEQYILRCAFANYSEEKDNDFVFFDYMNNIFHTMGSTAIIRINENNALVI